MVAKFRVGDIVKDGKDSIMQRIYIVADVADFTSSNDEVASDDHLVEYGLYQVAPVQIESKYHTLRQSDLTLVCEDGTVEANKFHINIKKIRNIRGWYTVPDFVKILNVEMKSRNVYVGESQKISKKIDTISSKTETVDDCLDAINYANFLYSVKLIDEAEYIELKEYALARLEELSC